MGTLKKSGFVFFLILFNGVFGGKLHAQDPPVVHNVSNSAFLPGHFTRKKVVREFFQQTFYPGSVLFDAAGAGLAFELNRVRGGKFDPYSHRLERVAATRTIQNSMALGLRILLKEDDSLRVPTDGKIKFTRFAFNIVSFQDESQHGHRRIAWARLISVGATGAIKDSLRPWAVRDVSLGQRIAVAYGMEAARSFCFEYAVRPLKRIQGKIRHKNSGN